MTKTRGKQTIAAFMGLALSATVLGGTVEDRTVNHLDRQVGRVEQDDIRGGPALQGDRVLTADSRNLLKVRDRDRRSDRGRGSHRGRDQGHRRQDYSYRQHDRYRHNKHGDYGHYRPYRRHYHRYGDGERLLWYGLGVLTPYLLDDRYR